MKVRSIWIMGLVLCVITLQMGCRHSELTPTPPLQDSCTMMVAYQHLRPMLMRYCNDCHATVLPRVTPYEALKAGALDNGKFEHRVLTKRDMPTGISLTDAEFDSLRCWAEAGFPAN